jgi:hypothetical protein
MADVALRGASDGEIAAVFRANAEHIMATLGDEPVVYVRFQTIDGRRWGLLNMVGTVPLTCIKPVFYALRRRLRQECEPIYALATNAASARLLRLIGLEPTTEIWAGKQVWVWTPVQ